MSSIVQVQQELLGRIDQMKQAAEGAAISANPLDASDSPDGMRAAFAEVFKAVDGQQHKAGALQAAVDAGVSDDLVGAMVESQKASVAFSALMQVRNKVTGAFEEVMRMPV